jgi:murein L,D-transpeptidase YafK
MQYLVFITLLMLLPQETFKATQLKKARVKAAYDEKESVVRKYFTDKKLQYEGFKLFLRAIKDEAKLEVWVSEKNATTYTLLHSYDFCAFSGDFGPKRKEGDLQIPEGVYHINHFNPESNFHLSLGVSYPNASDKILSDKKSPGGAIYIHGNCVTVGCIPITDDKIKELYIIAVEARNNGQKEIPIHIFPARLTEANTTALSGEKPQYGAYWKNLNPIFEDFEKTKKVRAVKVNKAGEYFFDPAIASD